ncbi:hypothetical protein DIC66_04505 [Rhodoferax lacus]|uniref:O-antigen ligase-related domain-containing protein n=1 Tax=Rhodoferax lacus TaxID=2184758 RepID=A0A3E1RFE5_9BURK|nr:O-antigen ligase family protein [Rhodoferax lacus]RFO97993.1 hypothetical protein DIC66_04505 [Rhodoferax lacus]
MPEYIRALVFILVMTALVFKFSEAPATAIAIAKGDFKSRRNTWIYITLAGFLSQNIWIFYAIVIILALRAAKKDSNKVALFFFLILAMPELNAFVPGFAGISYFIAVTYQRVLVWIILLPIFWRILFAPNQGKFKWNFADIVLVLYFSLNAILQFQYLVFTEWVRYLLGWVFDVLIPYFAISRTIKDIKSFRDVVMSFVVGAMVISVVGIFEFSKQWLVYQTLSDAIGVDGGMGYMGRGGNLRAIATTGQAIVLGYVLAIALTLYVFLNKSVPNKKAYFIGFALLIAGEISPLSKGPWVGVAIAIVVSIVFGAHAFSRLAKAMIAVLMVFTLLLFTDYGDTIISYLPFVGKLDEGSMDYRRLVIEKSMSVIYNNPYFGSNDYWLYLEDLRQGQGIIDIVNNYIGVALNSGFVGLFLYLLFFCSVFSLMFRSMRRTTFSSEEHELGQVLIGALVGIMVMMSSVSDILNVPLLCWGIAAMGIAYSKMVLATDKNST